MLEPGHQLGRYRVEAQLGAGGMGEVYRAWDSTLRRWVALKVVAQNDGTQRAERLLGEARAAAALRHPNIVSVFDVGEQGGFAFVSMDLVEGQPLRDYIGDESVPQEKRLAWLLQIASALRAAHKAGLIHRDIKPDNVMITAEGEVRVLDFGLAKAFTVDVEAPTAHEDASGPERFLTGAGRVIGTPAYMAPEQLAGAPASPSWDQYAWGVLACELLTGQHPRLAGLISVSGWVKAESLAHVPEAVAQVVGRAMAPSPDQRFSSMEAIIAALGGPVSGSGSIVPASAGTNPPPKAASIPSAAMNVQIGDTMPVPVHPNAPVQQRSRRWVGWVAVALAMSGVGASAVWWQRTHTAPTNATVAPSAASSPAVLAPAVPVPSSSAPLALPSVTASVTSAPVTTAPPSASAVVTAATAVAPPKRKLSIRMWSNGSMQYDGAQVERMVVGVRPLVLSCFEQHPPNTLPAVTGVTLELWSIGGDVGKVRDVKVREPPGLATCLRDVFMPLSMGPPKGQSMPPGAVFVNIQADRL